MMARLYKYTILIGAMVCLFTTPGFGDSLPPAGDLQLIALINQARSAPLKTAAAYGRDPADVLSRLPEMEEILTNGLPPVHYNQALSAAAEAHTRDMIDRAYYSKASPEGLTVEDRISLTEYPLSAAGETLGMVGFINYLAREDAVVQIFRNMFFDELDPERTEPRMILSPDVEDLGVAVGAGQWTMDRVVYNVYLATCDFAAGRVSETEFDLLSLVNRARTWPLAAAWALGIDPEEISALPFEGVAPVSLDGTLYAAADRHAEDMMERGYFSTVTPEGKTPGDRMEENGYEAAAFDEYLTSQFGTDDQTAEGVVRAAIETKLIAEMTGAEAARQLLNPIYRDMGIRNVSRTIVDETGGEAGGYHLLVADMAEPAAQKVSQLLVFGYADANDNGQPDAGEGFEGISFSLFDAYENVLSTETGKGGYFGMSLEPGLYRLTVPNATGEGISESIDIEITDRNVALWIGAGTGID